MADPSQYTYLLAIGFLFSALDAYGIGANDVANSFATSVSSRSLKMWQAIILASIGEFLGAVLLGSRVTATIKNSIVPIEAFETQPYVLMLMMTCALISSSTWLILATWMGLPVSTTHSIVGAIAGAGCAALGFRGPNWGWAGGNGIGAIISSWFIAPAIAGVFAAIIYLLTKYFVLVREDSLRRGLFAIPVYFAFTLGVLTMMIVWKGAPALGLANLSTAAIVGSVLGVALVTAVICISLFLPYFYRRLVMEDWRIQWYHVFYGPVLLSWGPVPPCPDPLNFKIVPDYHAGYVKEDENGRQKFKSDDQSKIEKEGENYKTLVKVDDQDTPVMGLLETEERGKTSIFRSFVSRIWDFLKKTVFKGFYIDIVAEQQTVPTRGIQKFLSGHIAELHCSVRRYDNKTEYIFSLLQVFTATTASFAHGSNDVSNAMGPLTAIYQVWSTGTSAAKLPVPIWILAFGGAMIVIGLSTYGYNLIRNLGNRLTLQSPSRGYSMELGASLTVVLASRLGLPISTTQCIVGAMMAVGLCNGDIKAVNWRMVTWCYAGWLLTLPITATVSGLLMAIIINAPRWEVL